MAAWVALAAVSGLGFSQDPLPDADLAAFRAELTRQLSSTGWRSAEWGVLAVSLDRGDTLYARSAGTSMIPASNVKLVTTAAALHYLGPDFRYETYVVATGDIVGGRLQGDLVLYGTGDPGLSDRFYTSPTAAFEAMTDQIVAAGITVVEGALVGDGSYFSGPLLSPSWNRQDLNDWFAAPVGSLSYNENVVTLQIQPGPRNGSRPAIVTTPEDPGLPIENRALTGPGRVFIEREHPQQPIRVVGSMPSRSSDVWRRLTVRDPARFATQALYDVLQSRGIHVAEGMQRVDAAWGSKLTAARVWAPSRASEATRIVARHQSPPLIDYLSVVNKESHNFLADATLKTLGRIVEGDGSFAGGAAVLERFLTDEVAVGGDVRIIDGSGLSSSNRLSPAAFVSLLTFMSESEVWPSFWETLPEAGNRRELGRMYRTAAAGNLRAKTGTIRGVSALSGLVQTRGGERVAFSILSNRVPSTNGAKRIEDRIGALLASFSRNPRVAAR